MDNHQIDIYEGASEVRALDPKIILKDPDTGEILELNLINPVLMLKDRVGLAVRTGEIFMLSQEVQCLDALLFLIL